jgi:hypothetical protein
MADAARQNVDDRALGYGDRIGDILGVNSLTWFGQDHGSHRASWLVSGLRATVRTSTH